MPWGTAWSQSGDVMADRTCRNANQVYCEGGMEKVCTKAGQVNGRPLWVGVITGHNENCRVGPSQRQAKCYGLMRQWNAKRIAFNTGQCKRYYPGTAVAAQCHRLKATLLAERSSIAGQCAGILQITPP